MQNKIKVIEHQMDTQALKDTESAIGTVLSETQ